MKKLTLYISAFVPMYVLVFVKLVVEILNQNFSLNVLNSINLVTLVLLIASGIFGLVWNVFYSKGKNIEVEIVDCVNITDQHFLGYFSLFVFFAIPLNLAYMSSYCVYVIVLVMIGIVYINNSLFYINPLLNLLGYKFFDITCKNRDGVMMKLKIFCRGEIIKGMRCEIVIKDNHFCFVDKNSRHGNKKCG